MAFTKRAFRLEKIRIDNAFDDDLGISRHDQVDRLAMHGPDSLADETAGNVHLVHVDWKLLWSGEQNSWCTTDHDCAGHKLPELLVFLPVQVSARTTQPGSHTHAKPVIGFECCAIGAHVLDAVFRILRHTERRSQIRRRVKSGSRDWDRKTREPATFRRQILSGLHDFMTRGLVDQNRRDGISHGLHPQGSNSIYGDAEPGRVNFRRGRKSTDKHRNVITFAMRADDIGEQKGTSVLLAQTALKLPARERVEFGIFVDRTINSREEASFRQPRYVFVQIGRCFLRHGHFHRRSPIAPGLVGKSKQTRPQAATGNAFTSYHHIVLHSKFARSPDPPPAAVTEFK